jgi:serine/threonine-protein kinase
MDFVDGENLANIIAREAPFAPDRVINLMKQLCMGLGHAHDNGLVHRDFKSENVLIANDADGELAKIVDFGIAVVHEAAQSGHKLTTEGMVLGTPAFMAPEQATGGKVDHRSDLFSLGVLMYEMMSGKLPFDGTPLDIARQNPSPSECRV